MVKIRNFGSWYNVYIDNTLILKRIYLKDVIDIIEKLHNAKTDYQLIFKSY